MRADGRENNETREISLTTDYVIYPEGSVLVSFGNTRVLVNASVENRVPSWMMGQGKGWVTAEYSMLPRATMQRKQRERASGKPDSRSLEISRLIGRSIRAMVDITLLGERTITIDCDVLQADGGTRTTSINGACLAVELAVAKLLKNGTLKKNPLLGRVAAISVGMVDGQSVVDLNYDEDSHAEVDMNIVMNDKGEFIEVQGTAEKTPFNKARFDEFLNLADEAIKTIFKKLDEFRPAEVIK